MKQMAQIQQQQQQQAGNHQQQNPTTPQQQQQQQDRLGQAAVDVSNSFRPNDPVYGSLEPSPSTNSTGTGKVWSAFSTTWLFNFGTHYFPAPASTVVDLQE
jgi:hypothetical protein